MLIKLSRSVNLFLSHLKLQRQLFFYIFQIYDYMFSRNTTTRSYWMQPLVKVGYFVKYKFTFKNKKQALCPIFVK